MRQTLSAVAIIGLVGCSPALADSINGTVMDHYKTVINQTPYKVEICREVNVGGDKTGDALKGAIIGGIIGNNVTKNLPDGGTALRGNYAGQGYEYNVELDAFVPPKPNTEWTSWTISTETYNYEAPIPMPNTELLEANTTYQWNEAAYQANNQTGWDVVDITMPS